MTSDCILPLGASPRRAGELGLAGSESVLAAVGGEENIWLLSCIYPDSHADHTPSRNVFDLNVQVEYCILGYNKSCELAGFLHSHK